MQTVKQVTLIEGKLSSLIDRYVVELKEYCSGFEEFCDEAILYAMLEYSRFPRDYSKKEMFGIRR